MNQKSLFQLSIVIALSGMSLSTAAADTRTFSPLCDLSWQTCCDCGLTDKCVNWDVLPVAAPDCPVLPTDLDDVIIQIPSQVDPAPAPAALAGTVSQSGGNFLLNGTLIIGSSAEFAGLFQWQSGSLLRFMDPGVTVTLNGGGEISGDEDKLLGADGLLFGGITLINNSTLTISGNGSLILGDVAGGGTPARIVNSVGATMDATSNAAIEATAFGGGEIDNQGTLLKSAGDGTSEWDVVLLNSGLVHVQSGELHILGGGTATGEFRTEAGTRIAFAPLSPFELQPGVSFTGDGEAVLMDTGLESGIDIKEEVELNRLTIGESGLLGPADENEQGTLAITEELEMAGGTVLPPLHIMEGATLSVTGPQESIVGALELSGTAVIADAQLSVLDEAMTIAATGIVDFGDDGVLKASGAASQSIACDGTIRKAAGNGVANIAADGNAALNCSANSLIDASKGTLSIDLPLNGAGEIKIAEGAVLRATKAVALTDGTVTGSGKFVATLTSAATIAPEGLLTIGKSASPSIKGDFTQQAGGALQIDIAGLKVDTQHDAIAVEGKAQLGGELTLKVANNFKPAHGSSIVILTATGISGQFSKVNQSGLPNNTKAVVNYSNTKVTVLFEVAGNGNGNSNNNDNDNDNDNNNDNDNSNDNDNDNNNDNDNQNDNDNPSPNPNPDCGNGMCGANIGAMLPFMLAGLCARAMAARRRRNARRR